MREYHKQFNATKLAFYMHIFMSINGKFQVKYSILLKYNLPTLPQEEIENTTSCMSIKETESDVKTLAGNCKPKWNLKNLRYK